MHINRLIAILLLPLCFAFTSDNASLAVARSYYNKAVYDNSAAESLKSYTASRLSDAAMQAYHGAALALMAKHHWNPYRKYTLVQDGLSYLNRAAKAAGTDVEVRFLRFSVESNLPAIISFTSHIAEDKQYLINNLTSAHPCYSTIKAFMNSSSQLSDAEKQKLNGR